MTHLKKVVGIVLVAWGIFLSGAFTALSLVSKETTITSWLINTPTISVIVSVGLFILGGLVILLPDTPPKTGTQRSE